VYTPWIDSMDSNNANASKDESFYGVFMENDANESGK